MKRGCRLPVATPIQYRLAAESIRRCRYRLRRVLSDISLLREGAYPHCLVDLDWVRGALYSRRRELEDTVTYLTKSREEWKKGSDEGTREAVGRDTGIAVREGLP